MEKSDFTKWKKEKAKQLAKEVLNANCQPQVLTLIEVALKEAYEQAKL